MPSAVASAMGAGTGLKEPAPLLGPLARPASTDPPRRPPIRHGVHRSVLSTDPRCGPRPALRPPLCPASLDLNPPHKLLGQPRSLPEGALSKEQLPREAHSPEERAARRLQPIPDKREPDEKSRAPDRRPAPTRRTMPSSADEPAVEQDLTDRHSRSPRSTTFAERASALMPGRQADPCGATEPDRRLSALDDHC
jgi:hypothetical protein